jgi:hypothetical protein
MILLCYYCKSFSSLHERYTVIYSLHCVIRRNFFFTAIYKNPKRPAVTHVCSPHAPLLRIRVSSKQSIFFFLVRTETNRNSICFGCFSVCFAKPKKKFSGLFRCFGPVSKQPKQTEFFQNKPKSLQSL